MWLHQRTTALPSLATRLLLASALSFLSQLAWAHTGAPAQLASGTAAAPTEDRSLALKRAQDAVVGVQVLAVEEARSNRTLGQARQGSGVVIGEDDLVLTIGYLVLEADRVMLRLDDGRNVPARVLGYDVATGFGLVQALAPLGITPAPLARRTVLAGEALMIASGGDAGAVSLAQLVAQRPFSGYWEYHLDEALYTAPARRDHSGAGLFNSQGELVGIGSLFLADIGASGAEVQASRQPGNLFVPAALLPPILAELRGRGTTTASRRAWLGISCVDHGGAVRVLRVNDDSPADVAGVQAGDRIVRIDGTEIHAIDRLWKALWSGGAPEREVVLDIVRGDEAHRLKVFSVDRMKTLRRPQGI